MKLYATPLSHFSRKIRILLAELGVPFEWVRTPGVMDASAATYGDNPLLRIPTLVDGEHTVIESDHIARYLVAKHDPRDWFGVASVEIDALNRLAVTNGVMANEVTILLAKRGGLDISGAVYFAKLLAAIEQGLAWLDARIAADAPFDYRDIALISMWQHVEHYQLVTALERFPRIAARVAMFADRPSVATTTPASSLA
ncbi:MAG TPA: glutathione S-transferase family protein [Kofleriaceae bacterium]|nr:glutathione S-transferase family protein [Kofleriaceae bacterium]